LEQQIYRVPHSDDRGGVFGRTAAGSADRNLIDLWAHRR
jgi:porin